MSRQVNFSTLTPGGVQRLEPYVPGKPMADLEREYGIKDIIKLASNENPAGPPEESLAAIRAGLSTVSLYPDGAAYDLKRGLAGLLGVSVGQITLGNGSNEILSIIAETFLSPTDEAVFSEYAFVVYGLAVQATGAVARVAAANPASGPQPLGHCLAALAAAIGGRTKIVFIANPNNPTGTWLAPSDLRAFIAGLPAQVLVVLDEAYLEYMPVADRPPTISWLESFPNLIVCRTFSKMYGLAGLRVGYAISHPAAAELLNRVRQPFNVNALAQVAALAALGAGEHVERCRALNQSGLEQLRAGLSEFGWRVPPSAGNFLLADTASPAGPWYEGLLRLGIIVRPVANYGLPNHLRITVGLPEQNARLLTALRQLRAEGVGR